MKIVKTNTLIDKYTNNHRTFELSPNGRFYKVYMDGRLKGFIFNNDRNITIDGDIVKASEFFK